VEGVGRVALMFFLAAPGSLEAIFVKIDFSIGMNWGINGGMWAKSLFQNTLI
jgi:hypothetical protein